jgi:hypothetical protein
LPANDRSAILATVVVDKKGMLRGFISYSHDNHVMRDRLLDQLAETEARGHASFWADRNVTAGSIWSQEIADRINNAVVFLMLVSPAFTRSTNIRKVEWPLIRDGAAASRGLVVPVQLRPCELPLYLEDIQAVPVHRGKLKPISCWSPHDDGYNLAREQLYAAMDKQFRGWRSTRP